ncbi:alpha-N-acetylgalactosamine-specific lectin-like [Ciona intestinalis]
MLTKLFTVLLFTLCTRQRYVHGFVELVNGIMYEVVTDTKNFDDAEDHCRGLDGLLFYTITSASIQNALSNAITSNPTWNAHSSYWIGLDDTMHEGRFIWNKGEALANVDYTNFHSSVEAQSHEHEDCVKIDKASSWQWKVTNCAETRPFICQKATCQHRPSVGPTGTRSGSVL